MNGVGAYGGFQFVLEDRGQDTLSDLDRVAHQMVGASRGSKELSRLQTTFSANDPQVLVSIDREKAKAMMMATAKMASLVSAKGKETILPFRLTVCQAVGAVLA